MDVLVDLQFGSTGKGALAGYLSRREGYEAVVCANMPNAGHTAYCPDTDQVFIHKVLPSGIFSKNLEIVAIGPGAVFSLQRLHDEWEVVHSYNPALELVIHEAAGILLPEHRDIEQATLSGISSTMQGSAEAMISRIRRQPGAIAKHHIEDIKAICPRVRIINHREWLEVFNGRKTLVEGSQGYSLGISAGFYPYCTSRDCTPARVIADCGLPVKELEKVYASCRVHPIRVGNTPDGYSGDWYPDQTEITFESLGVTAEKTTVTQRVRRIATFSREQIEEAIQMAQPDEIFLNFYQYDYNASALAHEAINEVCAGFGLPGVMLIGHGPRPSNIEEV